MDNLETVKNKNIHSSSIISRCIKMKQDLSVFFLKKSAQVQLYIQVIILIKDLSMRLDK